MIINNIEVTISIAKFKHFLKKFITHTNIHLRYTPLWICIGVYVYDYIYVYIYMCVCVYIYVCVYVYMYVCDCVYIYVYVCMFIYIYRYVCVYVCMDLHAHMFIFVLVCGAYILLLYYTIRKIYMMSINVIVYFLHSLYLNIS